MPSIDSLGVDDQSNNQNRNIDGLDDKDGFYIAKIAPGTNAQNPQHYKVFFIAQCACEIVSISEVHGVANGDVFTLNIEKLTGTTALGSGTDILSTPFDLNGTANTVVNKNYKDFTSARVLNKGDRLALKPTATGGYVNISDVVITLYLKPLGKGHYR